MSAPVRRRVAVAAGMTLGLLSWGSWAARSLAEASPAPGASPFGGVLTAAEPTPSRPSAATSSAEPASLPAATAAPRSPPVVADEPATACHVAGIRQGVVCAGLARPLDPERPDGARIAVRYVVVPALARRKLPDPVFLLAGGPGQSAIAAAGAVLPLLARLNNRRDLVFVDQRGTGRSTPLECPDASERTLAEQVDAAVQLRDVERCRRDLVVRAGLRDERELGLFTTPNAVRDLDAVRAALGAERIDLVGISYGTRVALDYLRQFPRRVRRAVLDGVAPPDMALPASASLDNQAALDAVFAACAAEPACAREHPDLRKRWLSLLASLPRRTTAADPVDGRPQALVVDRAFVLGAVRQALYVPALAAALPRAIDDAAAGEMTALVGLHEALGAGAAAKIALGMHLSVTCAEDVPRLDGAGGAVGADFADDFARLYRRLCAAWPRGPVPAGFDTIGPSAAPVLLLSGGLDPATPPRHGERVARALGAKSRHLVVGNAGHGVLGVGCIRDLAFRFIDADSDDDALRVDASCAAHVPRPPAFRLATPASQAAR